MAMKLIKANVSKNIVLLDEVMDDLTNIRWGFQKAIEIQSGSISVDEVMKEYNSKQQEKNMLGEDNAGPTTI